MIERDNVIGHGAFGPEPERDHALGALLAEGAGRIPMADVDWARLAERISARVAARAASPWWTYAARWERRVVPIALAAGIAASVALAMIDVTPNTANASSVTAASVNTAVVSGTSYEDAALQFARSVTSAGDITVGVPE